MGDAMTQTIEVDRTITVDPEDQKTWADIVNASIFTIAAVARKYDVNENQLRRYLKGRAKPQHQTMEGMVTIMKDLIQRPRQAKNPARGYATEAEWEQLQKLGVGPERDRIMAAINKRSKAKGKEK